MTKHMQVCEIGAPNGAIFPPTTVNFAENGIFWLPVKLKRLFYQKTLHFTDMPHPWKKTKHMFTYSMDRALTFFKGDNSGTVNKI